MTNEEMKLKYIENNLRNPFVRYNGIELLEIEPDHALLRLVIREECRNLYGLVHGGAIYTIADNAAGCAVSTDGRAYVTQSGSMHFLRNQAEGEVRADARVRHRGKSTALIEVNVLGEGDKLLATGEFSFFCVDRELMLQKGRSAAKAGES